MDDDFNTPQAVSTIFEFVNASNRFLENNSNPNKKLCGFAYNVLLKLGQILSLFQEKQIDALTSDKDLLDKLTNLVSKYEMSVKDVKVEVMINSLLEKREEARKDKDWKTADLIRNDLDDIGFEIQDTSTGPVWRKK